MSANLIVDIGGTSYFEYTFQSAPAFAASGAGIGLSLDMLHADTFTNLIVMGQPNAGGSSGQLRIQVQTSDTDVSGNFTDPTSGLAQFPTSFVSGGILFINSGGLLNGVLSAPPVSGQSFLSGFSAAAAFQRPARYVRANFLSGDFYYGNLTAAFIGQYKTTGSGGGFTLSPTSGVVNV